VAVEHPHAEDAAVLERRARLAPHVAPADDLFIGERDHLRRGGSDAFLDEARHFVERRRLEHRQVALLARYAVERRPEAADVLDRDGNDASWRHFLPRRFNSFSLWR